MPVEVTVVVCTQGKQALLRHTLAALVDGDDGPRDIVVVVDGPAAAVAAWLPAGDRVRVIEKRSAGLNQKRNRGLAEAACDTILFTDDDCVPAPGWARAGAAALAAHPVITGRVLPLNLGYKTSIRTLATHRVYGGSFWNKMLAWRIGCGNNLGVRRDAIAAAGPFCERIGVGTWSQAACDTEFLFRVLAKGGEVAYVPDAVVYHAQPRERPAWLVKRRGYCRGVSYMARCIHPRSLAAWAMAGSRLSTSALAVASAALALRPQAVRRTWAQLRGCVEGLRPPMEER